MNVSRSGVVATIVLFVWRSEQIVGEVAEVSSRGVLEHEPCMPMTVDTV